MSSNIFLRATSCRENGAANSAMYLQEATLTCYPTLVVALGICIEMEERISL